MSQCGYKYVLRIKEDLQNLRQAMPEGITAHLAQIPGSPPVFLVKGPLFDVAALQQSGALQVEYVVTVTQPYPNSYPILTIEAPPQGWTFRNHPNIDRQGCCHLPSVARWDPRTSNIVGCVKELQRVLWANQPYQLIGGGVPQQQQQAAPQPQAPRPAPAPAAQAPPPHVPPPPQQQQQQQPAPPPMPQQTLSMGAMIFGATNLANGRTDAEAARQREADLRWRQEHEQRLRQQNQNRPVVQDESVQLGALMTGNFSKPSTLFNAPLGFGIGKIVTGVDHHQPMTVADGIPMPLPPCREPTPDAQYQQAEAAKANERLQKEQHAQTKSSSWGSLGRALNIGATAISNLASQAASSVEQQVRDSHAQRERQEFQFLFPAYAPREQLAVQYPASALTGLGCGVTGLLFISNVGVHFTTRRPDSAPVPITVNYSVAWSTVASIVKGAALGYEWLHLVMDSGALYSFYNITTSTTGMVGEQLSSLKGTPYSRCYVWMDNRWRAVRAVPNAFQLNNNNNAPMLQQIPLPAPSPAAAPVQAIPLGAAAAAASSEVDRCVVCMERQKNQFFQPCGHVCCCAQCAGAVRDCPMCRTPIQAKFQAFL